MGEMEIDTAGAATLTLAEADLAVLAWLVAVTVTFILEVQVGAVNIPELEIEPPEADQATAVFVEPVTVAVNCWIPAEETVLEPGEIEIDTAGAATVTLAETDLAVLTWLVAVTVTVVLELTVGAVKSPEVEIDPAVADQVTAVFVEPVTVAVNCRVPAEETVAEVGEMEIDTAGAATLTLAEADLAVLAWLVAVMVTVVLEVTVGAV